MAGWVAVGLAVVSAGLSQRGFPAIEADGRSIRLLAENVTIVRGQAQLELVTTVDLNDVVDTLENEMNAQTGNIQFEIDQLRDSKDAAIMELTRSLSTANEEISMLRGQMATQSQLQQGLDQLAAVLDSRLPPVNTSCRRFPELSNGRVLGHGDHNTPGAVRQLICNHGFVLNVWAGVDSIVICNANGSWSDGGRARCVAESVAPSPAPTINPDEIVTCCIDADNGVNGVYVDGQATHLFDNPRGFANQNNPPGRVTFHSSARRLGIWHQDGECGCNCGYMLLWCGTPSGQGRWNMAAPGIGGPLGNQVGSNKFKMLSIGRGSQPFGQLPQGYENLIDVAMNMTQEDFDLNTNGFVKPRPNIRVISQNTFAQRVQRSRNECPAVSADIGAGSICGGPLIRRAEGQRTRVNWFTVFDSTADQ